MEEPNAAAAVADKNKKTKAAACDVEALKKCLQDNNGDPIKCQSHIQAFKASCTSPPPPPPPPPLH